MRPRLAPLHSVRFLNISFNWNFTLMLTVDDLWHAAILDTKFYTDLQNSLLVLHHRPAGASAQESEQREKRLATMKALYKVFFSADPIGLIPQIVPSCSGTMTVIVRHSGGALTLEVESVFKIGVVKSMIQEQIGMPSDQQRLRWVDEELDDGKRLLDYGIPQRAILYVVQRARGC